jgi:hypothetical protein
MILQECRKIETTIRLEGALYQDRDVVPSGEKVAGDGANQKDSM